MSHRVYNIMITIIVYIVVINVTFMSCLNNQLIAQDKPLTALHYTSRIPDETTQSALWQALLFHPSEWYASESAQKIAENILAYQRSSGGWPKNLDYRASINNIEKKDLEKYTNEPLATIDNGATYTELQFLALIYQQDRDQRYMLAFLKGLDYLLRAQYDNGGWPQYYPLRKGYYSHITYNDDAMIGVMRLLREIAGNNPLYGFVDHNRREKAGRAVIKGIDCILKTQIKVNGKLTVWCAQYDEKTLKPTNARAYELVSLSGKESVNIVWFLMELENPSPEIINAVQGAIDWFNKVRIEGIRQERETDSRSPTGKNKLVLPDPEAPSIWARFYTIETNQPFFSDRDGKIYQHLSDISSERRNEYGWLGYWPEELLERFYPQWQQRWTPQENVLTK